MFHLLNTHHIFSSPNLNMILFSNLYTYPLHLFHLKISGFCLFLYSGPGYVSASESITRRKSPSLSIIPHLRYYKLTLQPNYGASYYGPGHLQEHYPNLPKSVPAQDGLRDYRHDLQCTPCRLCQLFSDQRQC